MKRQTLVAWVVAASVTAVGFGIAVAQPPGPGRGLRGIPDLTESQRTDIDRLRSDHWEASADQRQKLQDALTELNTEVFADAPNIGRIEGLKMDVASLQADMLAARVEIDSRIAQLLTPDQRAAMRERAAEGPQRGGAERRGFRR